MNLMAQPQTYLDLDTSMAKPPPNPLPNQTWSKNSFLLPLNFRPNEDEKGWTKFSLFFSLTHGNGGETTTHFFFVSISLLPILLILFFLTYLTNITCLWHVSTHSMAGHYALIWVNWHANPSFSQYAFIGHFAFA